MAKVLIKIEDVNNVANACRQVADLFEQGYTNGILGCSSDSWTITDYDEGNWIYNEGNMVIRGEYNN